MNENKKNIIKYQKLSSIFFIEIAEILNEENRDNINNFLITLTNIKINFNINIIKLYINIYPFAEKSIVNYIYYRSNFYRKLLSKRLRYRVKKIPKININIINN
ncbi:ribosome-binding factor A [Blattabacterium cuenoti]|uniref:ribosome-binding factor A n=1 Tax=Blattabacterium cuenoti TaxID=1653831 RepID=UPI00163C09D8|nr:ribosome-binding factor A [Blattabacterium cuenoti]